MGACTDSAYAGQLNVPGNFAPIADYDLLEKAVLAAREKNVSVKVCRQFLSRKHMIGNTQKAERFFLCLREKKFPLWGAVWGCLLLRFILMNFIISTRWKIS